MAVENEKVYLIENKNQFDEFKITHSMYTMEQTYILFEDNLEVRLVKISGWEERVIYRIDIKIRDNYIKNVKVCDKKCIEISDKQYDMVKGDMQSILKKCFHCVDDNNIEYIIQHFVDEDIYLVEVESENGTFDKVNIDGIDVTSDRYYYACEFYKRKIRRS